jgi:hypothetical protein
MPRVGLEPTIPVFERAKTVHALDRAANVIGVNLLLDRNLPKLGAESILDISMVRAVRASRSKRKENYSRRAEGWEGWERRYIGNPSLKTGNVWWRQLKSRLNSGNISYHSVHLPSKSARNKIYKINFIQRSRVRFPALQNFLRSSGSGTGSTQPREDNWEATWMKK